MTRSPHLYAALFWVIAGSASAQPAPSVIYEFQGGRDGATPDAGLILDSAGAVYGAARSGGASNKGLVFKLTPPAPGQTRWTKTTLYSFVDESTPQGPLTFDSNGGIYGAAASGGYAGGGAIFKLTPPAPGQTRWTKTALYGFGTGGWRNPYGGPIFDSAGALYGVTTVGEVWFGGVYKVSPPANGVGRWSFTRLYGWEGDPSSRFHNPYRNMIRDTNGVLFGSAGEVCDEYDGCHSEIFSMTPGEPGPGPTSAWGSGWGFGAPYTFGGYGKWFIEAPEGPVAFGKNGAIYSVTWDDLREIGSVIELVPPTPSRANWLLNRLYEFKGGAEGNRLARGLVFDSAGALYGATVNGGASDKGTVFKLTPPAPGQSAWTRSTLAEFDGVHGATPNGIMILDKKGALYGATETGGAANAGVVFRIGLPEAAAPLPRAKTNLFSLAGGMGGVASDAGFVMDVEGALYGVAKGGGRLGKGALFKLTPPAPGEMKWTKTLLYYFRGGADGATPDALVMDTYGSLYGAAREEGRYGRGAIFRLTPPAPGATAWTKTSLYDFRNLGDGAMPTGRLIFDSNGALFGVTKAGGSSSQGSVFRLSAPTVAGQTEWTKTTLHSFSGAPSDGATPIGGLLMDTWGALYGVLFRGGQSTDGRGAVFKLSPPAAGATQWTNTLLHSFQSGAEGGAWPTGDLVRDTSGALYGTTLGVGGGEIYRLTPPAAGATQWSYTSLYGFRGGRDGKDPNGRLALGDGGALYGATYGGGASGLGTAFKLTPPAEGQSNWTYALLHSFAGGKDGANPVGGVILDSFGALYGAAARGGAADAGQIFRLR